MAINYGTVAIVPKGDWNATTQYEVANLVTLDGTSYLAHKRPPAGTQPTDKAYWQVSAQGGGKATADTLGVVKPDGTTTEVDADGVISAKLATQNTPGIVKGSTGIKIGADGGMDVDTSFQQAAELANIIAGESIAQVLGKVSKSIAVTMNLDQNALLKNMLTNIDVNDVNKVPTSAYIHTLVERIGMGTELVGGGNLTGAVNQLNRDLVPKHSKLEFITNIDNPLPELGKTLIDGGDRYSYEFQAIYDNGNGTKSTARYTGYELITGGMRYGYQQVTTYGLQNNFAFRTLDEDRWSNWKVGVTKSDVIPYYNYVAAYDADVEDSIKAGLLSTDKAQACTLRVHVPGRSIFVFTVGFSTDVYNAYGVMVGDTISMLQSVVYAPGTNYKRSSLPFT